MKTWWFTKCCASRGSAPTVILPRLPIDLGNILIQFVQAEGAKGPIWKSNLRPPEVQKEEKFECDCEEIEIVDTLLG